ncbi:MAG: hypothetical protein AB7V50_01840 [Vampirovibrionia bacterium]
MLYKTKIKNISENKVLTDNNKTQNLIKLTIETEKNGQIQTETITLIGPGSIKATALV